MTRAALIGAIAIACASLGRPAALHADNPDELFAKTRAIVSDPKLDDDAAAVQLQSLREETGAGEIIRYGQAILDTRREKWEAVVEYVLHFPDDATYDVGSDWLIAQSAVYRRDFKTFELCVQRLVNKIKAHYAQPYQSRTTRMTLADLQQLERVLRWRDVKSDLGKRILASLAELRALDAGTDRYSRDDTDLALPNFWPRNEPFTAAGFRAALEREQKRIREAEADDRRSPELARIRAIRDEQRYQVEVQNYFEKHRGPVSVILVTAKRVQAEVEQELTDAGEFCELVVPIRLGLFFFPPDLKTSLHIGFEALAQAGVSDAVAVKWLRQTAPFATQNVRIDFDRHKLHCREGMRKDFAKCTAAGTATERLRHTLLLAALFYSEKDLVRELDPGEKLPPAEDYPSAAIQALAALDTGDDQLLPKRIERYVALLPSDSVPTERRLYLHQRLLVYVIDTLEERSPQTAQAVRAKVDEGLEKVRLNWRETPEKFAETLKYARFDNGKPKSLTQKRDLHSFMENYAEKYQPSLAMGRTRGR